MTSTVQSTCTRPHTTFPQRVTSRRAGYCGEASGCLADPGPASAPNLSGPRAAGENPRSRGLTGLPTRRPAPGRGPARFRVFERLVFPRPGPALRASLHSRPTAARAYGMPGRDSRGSRAGSTGTGPGPAWTSLTVW